VQTRPAGLVSGQDAGGGATARRGGGGGGGVWGGGGGGGGLGVGGAPRRKRNVEERNGQTPLGYREEHRTQKKILCRKRHSAYWASPN